MRAFSLARQLALLGNDVTLIASRSNPGFTRHRSNLDGVHQMEMPDLMPKRVRHGGLSPIDLLFRSILTLSKPFDVIHCFEHRPAVMLPGLIGQRARRSLLVADWSDLWGWEGIAATRSGLLGRWLGGADDYFETRTRLWADGTTAISTDLDRRLEALGIPQERRMILPPGANLDLILPVEKQEVRSKFGLPLDAPIVAFSGYAPYDEAFLSDTVMNILREDPRVLVISSGTLAAGLARSTESEGLHGRLIQFGSLPLIENGLLLGAADVLMLPYLNKPINRGRFPNKFGDFLAAGRPIVSHHTGDLGELIEWEALGLLSSEVPALFARDVLKLLQSPVECEQMGHHARRYAERQWSWALRAKQVSAFYGELLSKG